MSLHQALATIIDYFDEIFSHLLDTIMLLDSHSLMSDYILQRLDILV